MEREGFRVAMAIKSIPRRVADLEEREGIVYSFMDDLRKWTIQLQGERKELQADRKEHKLRLRELEIANAETQKRIAQNEKMIERMDTRLRLLEDRRNGSHKQ